MVYRIEATPSARASLLAVKDTRIRGLLAQRIRALADEPEKQGKPLTDELKGFYSVRAVGQRYRIIYRVERGDDKVIVALVGIRREGDRGDVYAVAERLVRRGIL
ncbi:MAG: type II toxin-antitoxin system RelE/ParE family toxin [Chloroflexi bacterium]|nr:type II toxin-antitoxin system RelE/ParE family toxin [Chloroflexota bacterium]